MVYRQGTLESFEFEVDREKMLSFARVSGDSNPIHVDPIAARRLLFGECVVHGIHVVLLMIDGIARAGLLDSVVIESLRAVFKGPVRVQGKVVCKSIRIDSSNAKWTASVEDVVVCQLALRCTKGTTDAQASLARMVPPSEDCSQLPDAEIDVARGELPLFYPEREVCRLWPDIQSVLSPHGVALLLASSRLVGMKCPGLHSVFSEIGVSLLGDSSDSGDILQYEVTRFDRRFRRVELQIKSGGAEGQVRCFVRPGPRDQASVRQLAEASNVLPGEFAGMRALVIGGSRGLGEIAAKLVAIGGGSVLVGFANGVDDAFATRDDILNAGYKAEAVKFDVLEVEESVARLSPEALPTSVLYFAAPPIRAGRVGAFSPDQFRVYCDFFVRGFVETVVALRSIGCSSLEALYPSSVYAERAPRGMSEYAASKIAGEHACEAMRGRGLRVEFVRLGRLATDQTQGLLPETIEEPASAVLLAIRKMREAHEDRR